MTDTITLRLVADGFTDVTVDLAEYEAAKAAGELDQMLDVYTSDLDPEIAVYEPDGTIVTLPDGNVLAPPEPVYLIWSLQHWSWWNPNAAGHTGDLWRAGRYTLDEAERQPINDSLLIPAPESGRSPSFDVGELARINDLMTKRVDAVKAGLGPMAVKI